jgi:methionine-R-sulfoxide reductase
LITIARKSAAMSALFLISAALLSCAGRSAQAQKSGPATPGPAIAAPAAPTTGGLPMIYTKEQAATVCYIEPTEELRQKLSPEEFAVLVEAATEPPFQNAFWDNHREGIYIDRIDGSPLFASSAKFDSGTGWPSFWAPIDPSNIVLVNDKSYGMIRIEVRARKSGGHLGHLFDDGPKPSGMRYCINSASLDFIPRAEMEARGYKDLLSLFR